VLTLALSYDIDQIGEKAGVWNNAWQRRYWEHLIRGEADFQAQFDYIHYNSFKHGWVKRVKDWPYSTFHRCVEQDVYPLDWARLNDDLYGFE